MKIHNTPQQVQPPATEAKEQRLDQVQEALDDRSVKLANLSDQDRAANRNYGAQMVGDIDGVKSTAPKHGDHSAHGHGDCDESPTMMDFLGYGQSGMPMMDNYGAAMMILQFQQLMLMMMMMMAMMEGAQMPPSWQDGWGGWDGGEGGIPPMPVDEVNDGGGPIPTPETEELDGHPETEDGHEHDHEHKQMTPVRATRLLQQYFDLLDTAAGIGKKDGLIGRADLESVANNPDAPKDLKDAVAYLLRNPMVLNAIDVGAGKGKVDGLIGKNDVTKFIEDHKGKEGYDTVAEADKPKPEPRTEDTPAPKEEEATPQPVEPNAERNAAELRAQQDATRIHEAVDGAGTDEDALVKVLGGRSNKEIQDIKAAYSKNYGRELDQVVRAETSGHLEKLLVSLLGGRASESQPVDKAQVKNDVSALHKAISGWGTDEDAIITILASRSKKHLAEVSKAYQETHGKPLSEAIKGDTSGILQTGLLQNL